MDAPTLLSILWRRWFVFLPIAILTTAAGVAVAMSANVRYETSGSELLVTQSQTGGQPSTESSLSPSLASSFVADSLRTPEFELGLREAGFASDVSVVGGSDSSVVTVTVTGEDPIDVFETAEAILDRAPKAIASFLGSDLAATIELSPFTQLTENQIVELEDSFSLSVPLSVRTNTANVSNPLPVANSTLLTLVEIASRGDLREQIEEEVPSGSFSVFGDARASAPIMSIQASAQQPADAVRVYEVVRADLEQQLLDFQAAAAVDPEDRTILLQLVPPETIEQTRSSTVRAAAGVTLLGLGFACLAAILVDLMVQRRERRRNESALEQTSAPASGDLTMSDTEREHETGLKPPIKRETPSASEAPAK